MGEYLERTQEIRKLLSLFISWVKPHIAVSQDTISRWIKSVLKEAGINLEDFSAHSVRGASAFAAFASGVA